MTKIYTKTGDTGETGLIGGLRVSKTDPRLEAYGTLDEVNASLGLVVTLLKDQQWSNETMEQSAKVPLSYGSIVPLLTTIQSDLFAIGAYLATPADLRPEESPIAIDRIAELEHHIDQWQASLPPLRNFILPGGSSAGAAMHVARTIVRRAERRLVGLSATETLPAELLTYVNRLSDVLFVAARVVTARAGESETLWSGHDRAT